MQIQLDAEKSMLSRNKLGQYATPSALADAVLQEALSYIPISTPIRFLDPAVGLGSFYDSLLTMKGEYKINYALGIDIDKHYLDPAKKLWKSKNIDFLEADFTQLSPPAQDADKYNLLVCNPPYVRHHHLSSAVKQRLHDDTRTKQGIQTSKLMGLYGYFMLMSPSWLQRKGVSIWLIPTEFMDVNYGVAIKEFLSKKVKLLRVHTFQPDDVQFTDALVSSTVVVFENSPAETHHKTRFTLGGSLQNPFHESVYTQASLDYSQKWSKLAKNANEINNEMQIVFSDVFDVRRGIVTGNNSFFIMTREQAVERQIPFKFLRPILPSSRYIKGRVIKSSSDGTPISEKPLFLLNCSLPEDAVKESYPGLWSYLEEGKKQGVADGYICRQRKPWYKQESSESPDLIVSYMGRSSYGQQPFKFFVNESSAIAANSYLMAYLKPEVKAKVKSGVFMERLLESISEVTEEILLQKGRSYGGGLHKLEPAELRQVPLSGIDDLITKNQKPVSV